MSVSNKDLSDRKYNCLDKVKKSALASARNSFDIKIVAASKFHSVEDIRAVHDREFSDFGENYVQELVQKCEALSDLRVIWHFIGHLQRNKVKYIAGFVSMIHSIDSFELAKEVSKQAAKNNRTIDILIQINTSGELSKSGVAPDYALELCQACSQLHNVRLCGLMTIPEPHEVSEDVKAEFRLLRQLRDQIKAELRLADFNQLSMGMSDDFEIAIEEGATIVRLGTALFGERKDPA